MSNISVRVILKSGKEQSIKRYHPWIFSGAIKKMSGTPAEGDLVEVYSNKEEFLAMGHYQIGSIAIRILSFEPVEINEVFWKKKIQAAFDMRKWLGLAGSPQTNVYRLIYAEGDGMPGLIADYYNGVVVLQMHSVGMYRIRETLVQAIREVLGDNVKGIYNKSENTLPFKADIEPENGFLWGEATDNLVMENGYQFRVDWVKGQKTGFFVDQRENRRLLQKYSGGRNVLNMFCYTGGFSVYALKNANMVHSVDSSDKAMEYTRENVQLNYGCIDHHKAITADAFDVLNNTGDEFDLIVLDPPAFAKHQNVLHNALQGYKRLNLKALEKIRKNGILFTFSCSQVVSRENFRKSVFAAAANTGRNIRILEQLYQPPDHPLNIYHPESEYLKGLVLLVE